MVSLNGRKVENIQIDGVDHKDHPDYCDAYFSSASFSDTSEDLTEDQLLTLTEDNPELVNEMAYMNAVGG